MGIRDGTANIDDSGYTNPKQDQRIWTTALTRVALDALQKKKALYATLGSLPTHVLRVIRNRPLR